MRKNDKKVKEFNIPIKIFGKKKAEADFDISQDIKKEIVPVMISKNDKDENSELNNQQEYKGKLPKYERLNKEIKINWLEEKSHEERLKVMWITVVSLMVIIVSVWAVFLKYNILLEKLSLKQAERDKEWGEVKDNFGASIENFEKAITEVKKTADAEIEKIEDNNTKEKSQIELKPEDVEKLKKKIMEKEAAK